MEQGIEARKTVTKSYTIGEHEYATLDLAKEAALASVVQLTPGDIRAVVKASAAVLTILLSKGHKKRGPRKKKAPPADPLAAHPTLPLPSLAPEVMPGRLKQIWTAAEAASAHPTAVPLAVRPPTPRNPIVPVLPGASTPDLGSIPMPEDV
jgi:hypothetical protein